MRKTIFKWIILLFLFAYATAVTIWANGEAAHGKCCGIRIEIAGRNGVDSLTTGGIRGEMKAYKGKLKGAPITEVNARSLENFLSGMSNFENVECWLSSSGTMNVKITPMVPELRVFENDSSYYINKDGKKIFSKASFFADVPVATGNFSEDFTPKSVLPVTRFVSRDKMLSNLVGMVEAKDADNIILVPRILGHVINFGDTNRLAEKRDALLTFYRKVIPYKGWEEYDTISLKFRGQIVATRRNKQLAVHGIADDGESDLEEATLPEEFISATPEKRE